MKQHIISILTLLLIPYYLYSEENNIIITDLYSFTKVKDEWKFPGVYSPANLFDNDSSTCYMVDKHHKNNEDIHLSIMITFNNPLTIDEIRLINGNGKNEILYKESRRVKLLSLYFKTDSENTKNDYIKEDVTLKDTMEFQNIKLSKTYTFKQLQIGASIWRDKEKSIYEGEKSNNICLTDILFYYKGNKINIINSNNLKQKYVSTLTNTLIDNFSDKSYYMDSSEINTKSYKDGRFIVTTESGILHSIPDRWKIKDSKLYMRLKGKWRLFEYRLNEPDRKGIILYDPDYNGDIQSDGILGIFHPDINN